MASRFTFDGALMFGFRAAHARSFPWKFALAFAVISTVLTALFVWLVKDTLFGFVSSMEQLDQSGIDDPAIIFQAMFSTLGSMVPVAVLGGLASLVIWAMFMTATQRRYIRDEAFSIRFGPDELRMMGAGLVWFLGVSVVYVLPLLVMLPAFGLITDFYHGDITEEQLAMSLLSRAGIVAVFFLLTLPFYVFFATRFSPVFAMTLKEGKIAFGDAWIASRGRFWPILGAYLIVAIIGGMAVGFASTILETLMTPAFMNSLSVVDDISELESLFTPVVVAAMLAYTFIRYFLSGLLMHFVNGPAAFAARHDPRGSVDDALNVSEFD
ncbi:hypothetical protein [uncultured Hyphomonas sp.]|uniref:hypothetical protein n=1 Tax=uncultured Hyphomonas sp. TaxID=225298 RepID=UPI002AAB239F|nr:hypothetical protein [uncultured Hyphomonas sp.]